MGCLVGEVHSSENGNRFSFRNVVFSINFELVFRICEAIEFFGVKILSTQQLISVMWAPVIMYSFMSCFVKSVS
jgi:hypothetical protein